MKLPNTNKEILMTVMAIGLIIAIIINRENIIYKIKEITK